VITVITVKLISYFFSLLDNWGSIPSRGREFFSLPLHPDQPPGAHLASYPMGTGSLIPRDEVARA